MRSKALLFIHALLLISLITASITFAQAQNAFTTDAEKKINKIENGVEGSTIFERMRHYNVPGVSIAVINGNKIEWAKGYGTINAGTGIPVTPASYFEAASTTKMLTAAIALHFVDKGMLDLNTDVNLYLKSWKIPENEFTKDKKVTLRLLLSHQSGLPSTNFPPGAPNKIPTLINVLNGESPAGNRPAIVEAVPGSKWNYSNIGYVVLQLLLEELTGKPLQQLFKEIIFEPLGMKNSTLIYPLEKEWKKNESLPHTKDGKAGTPMMHPTALAQGGLITTSSDLAAFTIELNLSYKGESNKILSKRIIKEMFQIELALDPAAVGLPLSQGMGVFIQKSDKSISFTHAGYNFPGSTSWQIGLPEEGKGVVILTNGANGNPLAMDIFRAIRKEYNWPPFDETAPDAIAIPQDEILKPYIGIYALNSSTTITISVQGKKLFADFTGMGQFEIYPKGKDTFDIPGADVLIAFLKEEGQVTRLKFTRDGKDTIAKKIK